MTLVAGSLKRPGKRQHCGEIVKPSSNVRKERSHVHTHIEVIWSAFEELYMIVASLHMTTKDRA